MVNFNRRKTGKRKNIEKMTKEPMFLPPHRMLREVLAMKFYYVTFRSVTHGQRGEQLLKSQGIRCHLLRTPKWMESKGCGYSLRIWTNDVSRPLEILRRENVQLQRVYIQTPEGTLEEINL